MSSGYNENKEDYIDLRIKNSELEEHVKRICSSNLKRPAKICTHCPFLGPVIDVMEKYDWKYNKEAMEEPIKRYYEK